MPVEVFFAIAKGLISLAGLGIVVWGIVAFARVRSARSISGSPGALALKPIEERLRQLEQSNESIALQVERIAEGQRFVTKLLASGTSEKSP
jgi:hypothetical protein